MEKHKKKKWKPNYFRIILFILIIVTISLMGIKITKNDINTPLEQEVSSQSSEDFSIENNSIIIDETVANVLEPTIVEIEQPIETTKNSNNDSDTAKPTNKASLSNYKYYIKVNYTMNVVTIYEQDSNGDYTVPIKAMICSTGEATPKSGVYSTSQKMTWGNLVGGVYGQYCTRIVNSILFHSVPYLTKYDKGSLEYWEYDKLGTTASAGCVRLTVEDAKWIYDNCKTGTKVEFYSDNIPGPLGKPNAQKISSEESVRGWDPTDASEENPWRGYKKEETELQPNVDIVHESEEDIDKLDTENEEIYITENNVIINNDSQDELLNISNENIDRLNENILIENISL